MGTNTDTSTINWDDVIKKEARGLNNADLGEIQQVDENFILTQKGTIGKEKFYIPKSFAAYYDGDILHVSITEEEAKNTYMEGSSQIAEEEESINIMEERIVISKRATTGDEIIIIKEPTTETKTVQVEIAHEEAIIDKNSVGEATLSLHPVETIKEIKIPLMKEEIEISKQPYIKEEVIIRKKPVIETRTITEEVKSEKVKVRRGTEEEEGEGREEEGREGEEKKEEIIG